MKETIGETKGPFTVAYRRHVSYTGELLLKTEYEEYSYHMRAIVQYASGV